MLNKNITVIGAVASIISIAVLAVLAVVAWPLALVCVFVCIAMMVYSYVDTKIMDYKHKRLMAKHAYNLKMMDLIKQYVQPIEIVANEKTYEWEIRPVQSNT